MCKVNYRTLPLLLTTLVAFSSANAGPGIVVDSAVGITAVTSEQVFDLAEINKDLYVLDVSLKFDYDNGHIPGALNLPSSDFSAERLQAIIPNPSSTLMIYCGTDTCADSWDVAIKAKALGYTNIYWYRDGMNTWRLQGYVADRKDRWLRLGSCS